MPGINKLSATDKDHYINAWQSHIKSLYQVALWIPTNRRQDFENAMMTLNNLIEVAASAQYDDKAAEKEN